jgi:hypothetical protein
MSAPRDDQVSALLSAVTSKDRDTSRHLEPVTAGGEQCKVVAVYPGGVVLCAGTTEFGTLSLGTWFVAKNGSLEGVTPERFAALRSAQSGRGELVVRVVVDGKRAELVDADHVEPAIGLLAKDEP